MRNLNKKTDNIDFDRRMIAVELIQKQNDLIRNNFNESL